jgi:hypothetical protein
MAYGAYHPRNPRGQQRDKLYREALRLVLAEDPEAPSPEATASDGPMRRLRRIARTHVEKAEAGDMQAIKELADRLDGKPTQMLEHTAPSSLPPRKLTYEIVHVTEAREQLEAKEDKDLLVDYREIKTVNGHGHDHADSESNAVNGNGHGRRE